MLGLISTIQAESEAKFQARLMEANDETRAELLEMRLGIKKRNAFMAGMLGRSVCFETAEEKLEKLQEWYPRAYRIIQTHLPGFILNPNDMPRMVLSMADGFVKNSILPADRRVLGFCSL